MGCIKLEHIEKEALGTSKQNFKVLKGKSPLYAKSALNYSPYGMVMPDRATNSGLYRYGYQNQEVDPEIKGEGNSINYKYRMHDPRLGRFFQLDPLAYEYPHNSPYAFSENRVIDRVELEGLESAEAPQPGEGGSSNVEMKEDVQEVQQVVVRPPHPEWEHVEGGKEGDYNSNSGYEYNNSDLDVRQNIRVMTEQQKAKWGWFARDVLYTGITSREVSGRATPISINSARAYYGDGFGLLMYAQYLGMMFEGVSGNHMNFSQVKPVKFGKSISTQRVKKVVKAIEESDVISKDLTDGIGIIQNADEFASGGIKAARQRFMNAGYRVGDIKVTKGGKHMTFEVVGHDHISQIQFTTNSSRHGGNYIKLSLTGKYKGKIKLVGKEYKSNGEGGTVILKQTPALDN